ncbi:MAG TPA: hypothetical protein VE621_01545, partial [Bryobacteraceae bacterium]|nr:hypothetical protein [Bryobacteraceae bacterium]
MNRPNILMVAALAVAGAVTALGQSSTFRVSTEPAGAIYYVDGTEYRTPQTFVWEQGSRHILQFLVNNGNNIQLQDGPGIRYVFSGWADDQGLLSTTGDPVQVITANPRVKEYKASLSVEYRVNLLIADGPAGENPACGGSPGPLVSSATRPGLVYLNGNCFWNSTTFWQAPGELVLNAFPFPGYVFRGWSVNLGAEDAFLRKYQVKAQVTLAARFSPAKRVKFVTEPLGRDVLINRTVTPTPTELPCGIGETLPPTVLLGTAQSTLCIGEFDFDEGARVTMSAPSPQTDKNGKHWVFDSWSNGTGQDWNYTATQVNVPVTFTGRFIPGVQASLITAPVPLRLTVDGRETTSANFVFGVGKKVTISAPAEQTDARGRKYVFKSWSNGGARTQEISMPNGVGPEGFRLTANYELLNRAVLRTTVPGVPFNVDGVPCNSPCTLDREAGSQVRISVPATLPVSEVQRYEFAVWQDGPTTPERSVTFSADTQAVNANYRVMNRLTVLSDPAEGASMGISPASPDSFYSSDQQVYISLEANQGFRFRRWEGDLEGTAKEGWVAMSTPRTVRALLDKVPYIPPSGVRNAVGETPVDGVAPGSLISVYGSQLAKKLEVGPNSPLSQTIGGTVVLVGERILPLIYVSPEQINAQLPYDLEEGTQKIVVKTEGLPDVEGSFRVVHNAPGLFVVDANDRKYALAFHEDGSQITSESPARRNEVITMLGTGFGPFSRRILEGFATPDTPTV